MATREGIYVGGHEIVERYVGNRLVWEKFVAVQTKTYDFSDTSSNEKKSELFVSNTEGAFHAIAVFSVNAISKCTRVKRGNVIFSGISIRKHITSYGYQESGFSIIFRTVEEKRRFIVTQGDTTFYKKRGN